MGFATPAAHMKRSPQRIGQRLQFDGTVTMSNSYAPGGDTIRAADLGMNAIMGGIIGVRAGNGYELLPQTDGSAKVKATVTSTGAQVANAVDLSTAVLQAIITGR